MSSATVRLVWAAALGAVLGALAGGVCAAPAAGRAVTCAVIRHVSLTGQGSVLADLLEARLEKRQDLQLVNRLCPYFCGWQSDVGGIAVTLGKIRSTG